jgi:hypothetical protein
MASYSVALLSHHEFPTSLMPMKKAKRASFGFHGADAGCALYARWKAATWSLRLRTVGA